MRVIQCFRAPLGGLFRHVADLTRGLVARGVKVAILCDSTDNGPLEAGRLADLASVCELGLHRTSMARGPSPRDLTAALAATRLARRIGADIIHGHGAKGGTFARLAARLGGAKSVYTAHGGSLHHEWRKPSGAAFLGFEWLTAGLNDAMVFESAFVEAAYRAKVGRPRGLASIIHNGVGEAEFAPVATEPGAADIVFIGEMRALKGPFVLIEALARLAAEGRPATALFVGRGSEETAIRTAVPPDLASRIQFAPPLAARDAFARARLVVVPSLAESLPYIVLEAAAAGRPMIATRVGGIPEIFGPQAQALVPAADPAALAAAIAGSLADWPAAETAAGQLRAHVAATFSLDRMVDQILDLYRALHPSGVPADRPSLAALHQ